MVDDVSAECGTPIFGGEKAERSSKCWEKSTIQHCFTHQKTIFTFPAARKSNVCIISSYELQLNRLVWKGYIHWSWSLLQLTDSNCQRKLVSIAATLYVCRSIQQISVLIGRGLRGFLQANFRKYVELDHGPLLWNCSWSPFMIISSQSIWDKLPQLKERRKLYQESLTQ
jgi:hypothetical protein